MPRINTQKKSARGKDIKCGKCAVEIKVGETYRKWSKRHGFGRISGTTYYRCMKSECDPKPSELLSGRAQEIAVIGESFDDVPREGNPRDIAEALTGVKEEAESLRDDLQGGLDNMPEGLQQGETGERIQERIDNLETFIDECDSAIGEIESLADEVDELETEQTQLSDKIGAADPLPEGVEEADFNPDTYDGNLPLDKERLDEIGDEIREKEQEAADHVDGISFDVD